MKNKKEISDIPQDVRTKILETLSTHPEYKKLVTLRNQALMEGRPIKAMELRSSMASLEDAVYEEYLKQWNGEIREMEELCQSMTEEDLDMMNAYGNAVIMLADVLESLVMDTNQLLKKYHPDFRLEAFDKLNQLAKEAGNHVRMLDRYSDDRFYTNTYCDTSDKLYDMIIKKSKSFINKMKKHEEKTNKKSA